MIVFVHIPKVAGTSFLYGLIYTNLDPEEIYQPRGVIDLLKINYTSHIKFVHYYIPFGVHRFLLKQYMYFTFLRNHMEWAIFNYYYVLQCNYLLTNIRSGICTIEYLYQEFSRQIKTSLELSTYSGGLMDNLKTRYISGY